MSTIWRFDFDVFDVVILELPTGARFLPHVEAIDPRALTVWAVVDTEARPERRVLRVYGTGNPLGEVGAYLGSAVAPPFVWHVFEATA